MLQKSILALVLLFASVFDLKAQSKTTTAFHEEHESAFTLFFYKNTLQMLNVEGNETFNELIEGIDKMKLLRIDKSDSQFSKGDYKSLVSDYQKESFENLMNMQQEGMHFDAYIKEKDKVTEGLIILVEDKSSLSILDIKGAVPLQRIMELFQMISKVQQ